MTEYLTECARLCVLAESEGSEFSRTTKRQRALAEQLMGRVQAVENFEELVLTFAAHMFHRARLLQGTQADSRACIML